MPIKIERKALLYARYRFSFAAFIAPLSKGPDMRKALIVGVDYYEKVGSLGGCVNDAHGVKAKLERHADASVNFGTKLCSGVEEGPP